MENGFQEWESKLCNRFYDNPSQSIQRTNITWEMVLLYLSLDWEFGIVLVRKLLLKSKLLKVLELLKIKFKLS